MRRRRRLGAWLALAGLVALAGCGGLGTFGATDTPEPTVTPAPVPEATATPTATPDGGTATGRQPRYLSLRPTCERPPGLVVKIQMGALRNNDPATNEGINTTWQFASPENRRVTGPFSNFVEIITQGYRPLLDAREVTYGPLERTGDIAVQTVTVTTADGTTASYEWTVRRQTDGEYVGCWMTASVVSTPSGPG